MPAIERVNKSMDTTVAKGMAVIEHLAQCEEPQSLHEMVEALGYGKSNVHRLLRTYIELGYVRQEGPKGRYALTTRLWEIGVKVVAQLDFPQIARPHLVRLSEETGETALLAIRDGLEVIYLDRIVSDQPIGIFNRIGRRVPAWCNATGRVILAFQNADIAQFNDHLIAHTPHTITDPDLLSKEFERIRKQHYALTLGEWHDGVYGLAAPVFDAHGQVTGSIGITGTIAHYQSQLQLNWPERVITTAKAISHELGFRRIGQGELGRGDDLTI